MTANAPAVAAHSTSTKTGPAASPVANAIWADKAVAAAPSGPKQMAAAPAPVEHPIRRKDGVERGPLSEQAKARPVAPVPAYNEAAVRLTEKTVPPAPKQLAVKPAGATKSAAPASAHTVAETRGHGDTETRRHGDSGRTTGPVTASPRLPLPASPSPRGSAAPRPPAAVTAARPASQPDRWVRMAEDRVAPDAERGVKVAARGMPGRAAAPTNTPTMPPVRRVLTLRIGESQVLSFDHVTRAAVGNEAIADLAVLSGNQILVNGKTAGATTLLVWDRRGQNSYEITVVPEIQNVQALAGLIRNDVNNPAVQVRPIGSAIFLEGVVSSDAERNRAEAIATAHYSNVRNLLRVEVAAVPAPPAPPVRTAEEVVRDLTQAIADGNVTIRALNPNTVSVEGTVTQAQGERIRKIIGAVGGAFPVLDLLAVGATSGRQVFVRTQVIEINKTRERQLGLDWNRALRFGEARATPLKLDQFGPIRRLDLLQATLQMFEKEGVVRVLAEPTLLVQEGEEGSILIGGEIPIPVSQGGATAGSISVEYKEFGIRMGLKPTAIADDMITLGVTPEMSFLDPTSAVTLPGGFNIPGLRTRRASSVVTVRSNQTLAIGGLLQNDVSVNVNRVPLLGRIPILGELFKSRSFQKNETELVILITPQVLRPGETSPLTAPGMPMEHPLQDKDLTKPVPDVK